MITTVFVRKLIHLFTVLGLLAISLAPLSTAMAAEGKTVVVTASVLNLRQGPGLEYSVLQLLNQGQTLSVLEKSPNGDWTQVKLPDGTKGWVYSQFISAPVSDNGTVLVDNLNLRTGPGVSYRILKSLSKGSSVKVTGRNLASDWLAVDLADGTQGWVFSPYLLTSVEVASLPVLEAYGGPTGSGSTAAPKTSILVTIRDNQAVVDVTGLPAGKEVSASLGLPGKNPDMKMSSGLTTDQGAARLTFEMPAKWSDGSTVTQRDLVVTVAAGATRLTASIIYLKY